MINNLINTERSLVLASKSPRRKKLLQLLGLEFAVLPAHIDEGNHNGLPPDELVKTLALEKAQAVAGAIEGESMILGSDTIVVLNGEILGKPTDRQDAFEMLKKLSGNTHIVYTGIAIVLMPENKFNVNAQKTKVRFRKLDDDEIWAYIDTGSPMDKAGSYGIQDDFGAVFVDHIDGCYYNIVGLPLEMLYCEIKKLVNNGL